MQPWVSDITEKSGPGGRHGLFPPLMGKLLADRKTAAALGLTAICLIFFQMLGIPGWLCPLDSVLGHPCPGCGLTRSIGLLASGQWSDAVQIHPFAPLAAAAIILLGMTSILPVKWRTRFAARIIRLESRSGITMIALIALFCHWLGRLGGIC